jgi:hypothetical protein
MNFEIAPKETETRLNWDDARLYCFSLNVDGKTGWRLPTQDELNEIYQSENDFEKKWYWSSTGEDGASAWFQNFYDGSQYTTTEYYNNSYVRAIRSTV